MMGLVSSLNVQVQFLSMSLMALKCFMLLFPGVIFALASSVTRLVDFFESCW